MKLVSVAEMRAIEKEADEKGFSYAQMMEAAGQGLADIVHAIYGIDEECAAVGLVGSGNNGGDTLVALAALSNAGWQVHAYLARPRPDQDVLVQRVLDAGGEVLRAEEDLDFKMLDAWLRKATVVLDGVLGTGIQLPLKPEAARLLAHTAKFKDLPDVVAVDIPSGVDADNGETAAETIPADLTITMEAVKQGMLKFPALEKLGMLEVVSLSLPEGLETIDKVQREVISMNYAAKHLPARPMDANKGTFGTALIVAGSVNYTGAAYLAGKAAYLIGTGLVRMAIPGLLHAVLAGQLPEATWLVLPHDMGVINGKAVEVVMKNLEKVKAVLVGPGFGTEDATAEFIERLVNSKPSPRQRGPIGFLPSAHKEEADTAQKLPPLVVDADGLNLLSRIENWSGILPEQSILTPHPGEMSTLTGLSVQEIQQDRIGTAEKFAHLWGHIVVLKGAVTVIAAPDGRSAVIPVASPALARAGTGDVLAGMIVGLRAQGLPAFEAAAVAAWIHADAGLTALERVGHAASVMARDVLEAIPEVLSQLDN
jgi:ADP-dependent NAD(P)H-hydrate dehydratase / NAD(P)H-hydrate epimerase